MDIDNALIAATAPVTVISGWQVQLSVESRLYNAVHPARGSAVPKALMHAMCPSSRPFIYLPPDFDSRGSEGLFPASSVRGSIVTTRGTATARTKGHASQRDLEHACLVADGLTLAGSEERVGLGSQHFFPVDFALFQRLHKKDLAIVDQEEYRLACQHPLEDLLRRSITRGLRLFAQRCLGFARVAARQTCQRQQQKGEQGLCDHESSVCQLLAIATTEIVLENQSSHPAYSV